MRATQGCIPPRSRAPSARFVERDQVDATCPALIEKIIRFSFHPNQIYRRLVPTPWRGVSRSSRTLGSECGGRVGVEDEQRSMRTAKSCGPDASTLASSWRDASHHADDGDKKARSPGRVRRKPLKPLRRESRTASANLWLLTLVCSHRFRTRGRGCLLRTRFSLRPLLSEGEWIVHGSGFVSREQRRLSQPPASLRGVQQAKQA